MTRLLAMLFLFGLTFSGSGCCHHLCGGGYAPGPCNPCATYGAYPGLSQAYVTPAYTTAAVTTSAIACDCGPTAPAVPPY